MRNEGRDARVTQIEQRRLSLLINNDDLVFRYSFGKGQSEVQQLRAVVFVDGRHGQSSRETDGAAIAAGNFKDETIPVEVKVTSVPTNGNGASSKSKSAPKATTQTFVFGTDELPRADTSLEVLAKLKPAFHVAGTVTAGNSSPMSDGAAACVVMSDARAKALGLKPLLRFVSYATGGVPPEEFGMGPVAAIPKALKLAKLSLSDVAVIELNEAFAAQVLSVQRDLELPPEKTNPNGSGISLGHPLGATGAIVTVKALHELQRIGGRYALVTMCIGGGQGIAAIFEAMN